MLKVIYKPLNNCKSIIKYDKVLKIKKYKLINRQMYNKTPKHLQKKN